jgi:hypothetical protein
VARGRVRCGPSPSLRSQPLEQKQQLCRTLAAVHAAKAHCSEGGCATYESSSTFYKPLSHRWTTHTYLGTCTYQLGSKSDLAASYSIAILKGSAMAMVQRGRGRERREFSRILFRPRWRATVPLIAPGPQLPRPSAAKTTSTPSCPPPCIASTPVSPSPSPSVCTPSDRSR